MAISLEFGCPSCGETVKLSRETAMELPKTGSDVICLSCDKSVGVPEEAEVVTATGTKSSGGVVSRIDITYDSETRRVLAYEGITGMRDVRGRRYRARIDFDYTDPSGTM
jgi:uncharacterized metal-binding protein